MFRFVRAIGFVGLSALAAGCGAGDQRQDGSEESDENVGVAHFDLTTVPTGVGCVRLTVTGSSTVVKDFTLAAGAATTSLNMDRLPLGNIAIDGAAYATTCGTGSTLYIADTSTASLQSGVVSNLALTFRKNNPVTASVNFVGNVQAISAQHGNTYAVIDGTVYVWGQNQATLTTSLTPTPFSTLTNVVDLNSNNGSYSTTTCAAKSDGTLWCWGDNSYGQVGVATPATITTPTRFGTDTGYTMAAAGYGFVCAGQPLKNKVKCAGHNEEGELGIGFTSTLETINDVGWSSSLRSLSSGDYHTCGVDGSLNVRCWGYNGTGELGDGTTLARPYPSLPGVALAKAVGAGAAHSCAVLLDGTARCWGYNGSGQLGDGTSQLRYTPAVVSGLTGASKLSSGNQHNCVITDAGAVKCWGANYAGQIGDGTLTNRFSPTTVTLPDPALLVSAGYTHTCAVTTKQDIYCWGDNTYGELGDGSYIASPKPIKVKLP